jgi:hypothetical protein
VEEVDKLKAVEEREEKTEEQRKREVRLRSTGN